jgi:hypothetical protein
LVVVGILSPKTRPGTTRKPPRYRRSRAAPTGKLIAAQCADEFPNLVAGLGSSPLVGSSEVVDDGDWEGPLNRA